MTGNLMSSECWDRLAALKESVTISAMATIATVANLRTMIIVSPTGRRQRACDTRSGG